MLRAEIGSTVTISYIGTLDNGRIFHSTDEQGPLTVTIGADQLFVALEEAIIGMRPGETKNIVLTADEAYGQRRKENIITVSRQSFPAGKEIVAGQKLSVEFKGGASRVMRVIEVTESEVTLDGNHPLAGLDLTFALRLDRIDL
jgi:peptidylprolyl isomerase